MTQTQIKELEIIAAAAGRLANLPGCDAPGCAHEYAEVRFAAAVDIAAARGPGHEIDADIAPGFAGLPFATELGEVR